MEQIYIIIHLRMYEEGLFGLCLLHNTIMWYTCVFVQTFFPSQNKSEPLFLPVLGVLIHTQRTVQSTPWSSHTWMNHSGPHDPGWTVPYCSVLSFYTYFRKVIIIIVYIDKFSNYKKREHQAGLYRNVTFKTQIVKN